MELGVCLVGGFLVFGYGVHLFSATSVFDLRFALVCFGVCFLFLLTCFAYSGLLFGLR